MGQLTVRNVDERVIRKLKERAAKHKRSAEAEHREILRSVLLEDERKRAEFTERAAKLRSRLRSSVDSTRLIRKDRDRDRA
jgi:plasmid stability protein